VLPIDVVAALGFLQQADAVLGTDHSAFFARRGTGSAGLEPTRSACRASG
jgi:hypothetical protein